MAEEKSKLITLREEVAELRGTLEAKNKEGGPSEELERLAASLESKIDDFGICKTQIRILELNLAKLTH